MVDDSILKRFGKNLKKYRLENGLTQEELAEKVDLSVTFISLLESGKYNTTLLNVEKIAEVLKIEYYTLFK